MLSNMNEFSDKVCVVTGGASGIGVATVTLLAQQGATVYVLDLQAPQNTLPHVQHISCDLTDIDDIRHAIQHIVEAEQRVDVLVSNAGIHFSADIEATTEQDYQRVLDANFKSTFFVLQQILPIMRAQKAGVVVLVSSDQAFTGRPHSAIYGASKAAIAQLAKSTAIDYAEYGIRVNAVCPGTIDTPLYHRAVQRYSSKSGVSLQTIEREEAALQPLGRIGQPEEVAELIVFLCGGNSSFMTGGLYPIDGGYSAW